MSNESPNCDNATGDNPNGVPFGLHGGQPLGMLALLGRVQVLERLTSPTELVSQREAKKGRSDLDRTEGMECESETVQVLSAGAIDRAADPIVMEKTGVLLRMGLIRSLMQLWRRSRLATMCVQGRDLILLKKRLLFLMSTT
ncbi:hypothetical protein V6N13_083162 [Hibiscus sabdariffa]|uniref:Uncharacterized protein n=1 Tax=Hibiscus sabdariffa TaxID=183260 RepID=A0ABR2SX95_9ROSI